MEYCYVLDYASAEIYEIEITEETEDMEGEDLLMNHGLDPGNCHWMFTTTKKELNKITD